MKIKRPNYKVLKTNVKWGTIALTRNNVDIWAVWTFSNAQEKKKMLKEANNCVLNNLNKTYTHQVSLHYGLKPKDLIGY